MILTGLKYDNYSYKPSQGLYNSTYGTRGSTWDTPTYITDPNYYQGKALYDAGLSSPSYNDSSNFDYSTGNYAQTVPVYTPPDEQCRTSFGYNSQSTGSGMCNCKSGYQWSTDKTSCVLAPTCYDGFLGADGLCVNYDQNCQNTYGYHSHGDAKLCYCNAGYNFNTSNTSCIPSETTSEPYNVTPSFTPPPTIKENTTPPTISDFTVANEDIEPFLASGVLLRPTTFRTCPSGDCTVIKYYAETSKVNIIGKYKKGAWYEVAGSTDAKGGNGKPVTGWVRQSPFGEITPTKTSTPPITASTPSTIPTEGFFMRLWHSLFQ